MTINKTFLISTLIVFSAPLLYSQCPEGLITSKENLVKNGDFSAGNTFFESDYKFNLTSSCVNNFMLPEGYYSIVSNPKFSHCYFASCGDHTNGTSSMMVVNGATIPNQLVWKQKVAVKSNTTYYFSTWICNAVPNAPSKLDFSINGKSLGEPIVAPNGTCEWKQFFTIWNSEDNSEAVISIVNQSTVYNGNDFILDDIVFYSCDKPDFKTLLTEAKIGSIIELRSVFFDAGKDVLKEESFNQLNDLIAFLNQKPLCEIEVRGHTDNIGNDKDNQVLSEKRAKAVYDYLVSKSVQAGRLKFVGYGELYPIESNETLEGRQKNRRVEFKIIKQ